MQAPKSLVFTVFLIGSNHKVLITFNYKEGTQTITFEEAAEAASKGNGSDLDCFPAPQGRQLLVAVFFVLYDIFPLAITADKRT